MQWPCGRTDAFGFNPYTIVGNSALAARQGRSGADKAPFFGEVWDRTSSKPGGYSTGGAYSLAITAGGISSWQSRIVFSGSGNAAQGVNLDGSSGITFAASGSAAAIASAAGTGTITFAMSGTAVAPLSMTGNASATFSASGAIVGKASVSASTSFAFSASATTGARGWMIAVPIDQSLSPVTIAEAVWSASAGANNAAGTMGELVNSSGGGSSPSQVADAVWNALLPAYSISGSAGKTLNEAKVKAAIAAALSA